MTNNYSRFLSRVAAAMVISSNWASEPRFSGAWRRTSMNNYTIYKKNHTGSITTPAIWAAGA